MRGRPDPAVTAQVTTKGLPLCNASPLIARERNSPIMREWVRRNVAYAERPCASVAEMRSHPEFARVARNCFDDPNLGMLKGAIQYLAYVARRRRHGTKGRGGVDAGRRVALPPRHTASPPQVWILHDVLTADAALRRRVADDVRVLPTFENTFDFWCLLPPPADGVPRWSYLHLARRILASLRIYRRDDAAVIQDVARREVNAFKASSDGVVDFHVPAETLLAAPTTIGRLFRAATRRGGEKILAWRVAGAAPLGWQGDP